MTMYADKTLRCVTCGADFTFTAGEQQFHASKGFTNEPRRCLGCRQARRGANQRPEAAPLPPTEGEPAPERQEVTAGAARQPSPRPARPAQAATADSGRQRYAATCSACGGETMLSYEPVGNRPVLCSTCYDKIRSS